MRTIKNILIVITTLLCLFISGVIFFLLASGDDVLTRVYFLFLILLVVVSYHYKSNVYYEDKILKNIEKKLVIVASFIALGFNIYIVYQTFMALIEYGVNIYNHTFILSWNQLIDLAIFLFGLLGIFEIAQLRSRIQSVEEKILLDDEIDDIGNSNVH